ncbi:cGMP-dependent kinase [Parasponia andersonii]|uniref:cGMP-dependent kinase n=1 Tax=Parasponia andersonii TaxID=3476 RepID=A0A2P5BMZ6_PARAD|nr:cGMP-dependent kinase [Parasponia andersonii]
MIATDHIQHYLISINVSILVLFLLIFVIKNIQTSQALSDNDVETICKYLKPVIYPENSYIIQQGEPLDLMFFITDGIAWKYSSFNSVGNFRANTSPIQKGDFYGNEELLEWASNCNSLSNIPISTINVKVHSKVEALALTVKDLRNLVFTPSESSSAGAPIIRIKVE